MVKPLTLSLTFFERIRIIEALPSKDGYELLKIYKTIKNKLAFTEKEDVKIIPKNRNEVDYMWGAEGFIEKPFEFTMKQFDLIAKMLNELNKNASLTTDHYTAFTKFCDTEGLEDNSKDFPNPVKLKNSDRFYFVNKLIFGKCDYKKLNLLMSARKKLVFKETEYEQYIECPYCQDKIRKEDPYFDLKKQETECRECKKKFDTIPNFLMSWDDKIQNEFVFTMNEHAEIKKLLIELDKNKGLTEEQIGLYEAFCVEPESEPNIIEIKKEN